MSSRPVSAGINGWPTSNIAPKAPKTEDEQAALIDALQDWKSAHFQQLIGEQTRGIWVASCSFPE
jgi:hypothetical protein